MATVSTGRATSSTPSAGRSGARWRRLAAEVRARGDACCLCGQKIDYTIKDPLDPNAFTVEHIKSWSNHPELRTDRANLSSAHRRCNSSKGAGAGKPGLGLQSRTW